MTPSSLPPEFVKYIVNTFLQAFDEAQKQAAHILWSILVTFLKEHWIATIGALFVLFFVATLEAMMGRWGTLGSVLYHSLYFVILFIIGLIWGPEIFVSDFFHIACTLLLYPFCYFVTGIILDKIGVHKLHYYRRVTW